jgi:hypothetical protein
MIHPMQTPSTPNRPGRSGAARRAARAAAQHRAIVARAAGTPHAQVPCADAREQVPADVREIAAGLSASKRRDTARRALAITSGAGDQAMPSVATGHGLVRGESDTDGRLKHAFRSPSGLYDGIAVAVGPMPPSIRVVGVKRTVPATGHSLTIVAGGLPTGE